MLCSMSAKSKTGFNSKPTIDRRSPKVATPPEKPQTRVAKGSELQAQLNSVQEDLKKAKEQISLIEKEKAQAIDELKEAQKAAEEANERLGVALVAQKRVQENSEIEKFRAVDVSMALTGWNKPNSPWIKISTDGAVDTVADVATARGIARNADGWIFGFIRNVGSCSVEHAEMWGILDGLTIAWSWHYTHFCIEFDNNNNNVVDWLNSSSNPRCNDASRDAIELRNRSWTTTINQAN